VTDELNQEFQLDQPPETPRRRRGSFGLAIGLIVFAVVASASACLWLNYGDRIRSAVFAPPAAPAIADGEESVDRADFETFKRQAADSLQSAIEDLDDQKADMKRLTDQVAALAAKVDALQGVTSSMPAQTSVVPAAISVVPPRPAALAARKKPSAPKPEGRISVGGAPLPAVAPGDQ
jgi:hypothetical protein